MARYRAAARRLRNTVLQVNDSSSVITFDRHVEITNEAQQIYSPYVRKLKFSRSLKGNTKTVRIRVDEIRE